MIFSTICYEIDVSSLFTHFYICKMISTSALYFFPSGCTCLQVSRLAFPVHISLCFALSSQRRCPLWMSHTMICRRGDVWVSPRHPGVPVACWKTGAVGGGVAFGPIRRHLKTSGMIEHGVCVWHCMCTWRSRDYFPALLSVAVHPVRNCFCSRHAFSLEMLLKASAEIVWIGSNSLYLLFSCAKN